MADLDGVPVLADEEVIVDDRPSAETSAQGDVREVPQAHAGPELELPENGRRAVVQKPHGNPELLSQGLDYGDGAEV